MLNGYERRLILGYLSNLASRLHHNRPEARALAECVAERADHLTVVDCDARRIEERLYAYSHEELTAARWQQLRDILKGQQAETKHVRADRTALRIRRLGREMELSRTDIVILEFLLRYQTQPAIESIVDNVVRSGDRRFVNVFNVREPRAAGSSRADVWLVFRPLCNPRAARAVGPFVHRQRWGF